MLANTFDMTQLYTIADDIAKLYQSKLSDENINATGDLSKSAVNWDIKYENDVFRVVFNLEHYWYYVENGRRPGKMPPIDVIKDWIQVKRMVPRPLHDKIPSTDQLAFMIARKIGRDGIPGRHPLERTISEIQHNGLLDKFKGAIVQVLSNEIETEIQKLND